MGTVFSHSSLKLTCTNRCPSGSSATLPPAAAPHPLFLCRPGACTLGKCRTSTKQARTRRPTPTASPGSIAPTSSSTFSLSAAQNQAERVPVPFLPLETITQDRNGEPPPSQSVTLACASVWKSGPMSMMERRAHCGQAIQQFDRSSVSRLWIWACAVYTRHYGKG